MAAYLWYLAVPALMLLSGLAGAVTGAKIWKARHKANFHIHRRPLSILSQADQMHPAIIVLGDSIVERADLPAISEMKTLNAGISGASTAQINSLAARLLPALRPKLIVLAVGVNDASRANKGSLSDFAREYNGLVAQARATGATVVSMNVQAVAEDKSKAGTYFDAAKIVAINKIIAQANPHAIDLWSATQVNGWLPSHYTDDGIHPNPTGYEPWKRELQRAYAILEVDGVSPG